MFIFLTIWIFKIPQYRCHLNNVWNATLLERGLFSLLHFGQDTAVCVTKPESSETEALVECDEREDVIHNIHIDRHKISTVCCHQLPRLSHTSSPSIRRIPFNCRVPAFLNSLFIILRPWIRVYFSNSVINVLISAWIGLKWRKDDVHSVCWGGCDQSLEWIKARFSLRSKRSVINPLWIHSGFYIPAHGKNCSVFTI